MAHSSIKSPTRQASSLTARLAALAGLLLLAVPAACNTLLADVAPHVIYSYPGSTPPSHLISLAKKCQLGGLILFGENINSNLPAYLQSLQNAYAGANCVIKSPLLILTDQEGGEVVRLPGGPTQSEKQIGASSNPSSAAAAAGTQAAQALAAYHVNGNLAPVLDVFRQAGDFDDQYQRSYSMSPSVAGTCGSAFITAQQGAGYIATAKHFPGLGAATSQQNTDEVPVTLNVSLTSLRSIDEAPYVGAIKAGVNMVMTSWAVYPALDPIYPSGLSSKWIQGELRGRLGFTGVVVSDAIEAGALTPFGPDPGHRAILASVAGIDLILASARNATQGDAVAAALVQAVSNGTWDSSAFKQSSQRIANLRAKL